MVKLYRTLNKKDIMKKSTKWLLGILIIMVVASAVFFCWRYLKNKNQKISQSNSPELITINHHPAGKSYSSLQIILPAGWISVPNNVGDVGYGPINFFSSLADEQTFIQNASNFPFVGVRVIQGNILNDKISDLTKMTSVANTQILVENKIFSDGNYRCYQEKSGNQISVSCWVNYTITGVNFILNTFTDNYQSDLQSFYKTIESLKFIK